jgi:hypothetical protein
MKVSLRKANAIQKEIENALKRISLTSTTEVSVHVTDAIADVDAARTDVLANLEKAERLESIRYSIREAIGTTNAQTGINGLLTEKSKLVSGNTRRLKLVDKAKAFEGLDHLTRSLESERAKMNRDGYYHGKEAITANVLQKTDIEALEAHNLYATRRVREIDDTLLSLNVRSEIEIENEDAEFLRSLGII